MKPSFSPGSVDLTIAALAEAFLRSVSLKQAMRFLDELEALTDAHEERRVVPIRGEGPSPEARTEAVLRLRGLVAKGRRSVMGRVA
jgi:hypothetical protein